MLASLEDVEKYLKALDVYLNHDKEHVSPYIAEMARHIRDALMDPSELSIPGSWPAYFPERIETLHRLMMMPVNEETIGNIHFELARTFRHVNVLDGSPSFSAYPAVLFYAHPTFPEIPLRRTDMILFGVPCDIYSEKIGVPSGELREIAKKVETWNSNIGDWEKRVTEAEGRYRDVISDNNYLGLSHAFKKMIVSKLEEAKGLLSSLRILGLLAVLVPALQVLFGVMPALVEKLSIPLLSTAIFSVAVEVILIYYFRLIHSRWVALKSQISQLELRHAMCAFVHDYAEKSKDLNRDTLAKFENMIFSEVSQDNSPAPSLYDAADSIAKLLTAWKKPG